jgi:hypothetical protein
MIRSDDTPKSVRKLRYGAEVGLILERGLKHDEHALAVNLKLRARKGANPRKGIET